MIEPDARRAGPGPVLAEAPRRRLKVLAVASHFPNAVMPSLGTTRLERARALQQFADVRVVAPVPYFPKSRWLKSLQEWHAWSRVPLRESIEGLDVYHPRRLVVPKCGVATAGRLYAKMLLGYLAGLREEYAFDVIDVHSVWPDGFAVAEAARSLRVPFGVTAHGTDLSVMPRFPRVRPLIQSTLRAADAVFAVTPSLAELADGVNAAPLGVRVIANGVDPEALEGADRGAGRAWTRLALESYDALATIVVRRASELARLPAPLRLGLASG